MRKDSLDLEENRLKDINEISDYESIHERHRIFPEIFGNRNHKNIIDLSAGVGIVGKRIYDKYNVNIICNEICPKCLSIIKKNGIKTSSFDLDDKDSNFPFDNNNFDAVISLATIEHLIYIDHFVSEIKRILSDDGYLYISAPNYSGLLYLLPFLFSGRTFHNPLNQKQKYEFYAHVRYFTYRTLSEYISSFGFVQETVYLPVPKESTKYIQLKQKSEFKAFLFKYAMKIMYMLFSPRWASEPVLCFRKLPEKSSERKKRSDKIIL